MAKVHKSAGGWTVEFFRKPLWLSLNPIVVLINALGRMKFAPGNTWAVVYSDRNIILQYKRPPEGEAGVAGVGGTRYKITALHDDYVTCETWDGASLGGVDVYVAKPPHARQSVSSVTISSLTWTVTYTDGNTRELSNGSGAQEKILNQTLTPGYAVGDVIFGIDVANGTGVLTADTTIEAGANRVWMDDLVEWTVCVDDGEGGTTEKRAMMRSTQPYDP